MRKQDAVEMLEAIDPDSLYFEIRERVINKEESFTRKDAVEVLDWIATQLVDEDESELETARQEMRDAGFGDPTPDELAAYMKQRQPDTLTDGEPVPVKDQGEGWEDPFAPDPPPYEPDPRD